MQEFYALSLMVLVLVISITLIVLLLVGIAVILYRSRRDQAAAWRTLTATIAGLPLHIHEMPAHVTQSPTTVISTDLGALVHGMERSALMSAHATAAWDWMTPQVVLDTFGAAWADYRSLDTGSPATVDRTVARQRIAAISEAAYARLLLADPTSASVAALRRDLLRLASGAALGDDDFNALGERIATTIRQTRLPAEAISAAADDAPLNDLLERFRALLRRK
jgi:hypothetical protein